MSVTVAEIIARRENAPRKLPRKTRGQRQAAPKFYDAAHWDQLAAVYLRQYELPPWDAPCEPEAMERWLDRLDIPRDLFLRANGLRNLAEFVTLNPRWPLRAFVGLALEMKHEASER